MNQVKTIRTLKQLQALPLSVRSSLLEPKRDNSADPVYFIFRHTVTLDGIGYQLDWAALAKQLAPELQVRGEPGGYIYRLVGGDGPWAKTIQGNRPICQGWVAYAKRSYPFIASAARKVCGDDMWRTSKALD